MVAAMKKIIISIMFCMMILSSCTNKGISTNNLNGNKKNKIHIVMIGKGYENLFWERVKEGATNAAETYGIDFDFEAPKKDTAIDEQLSLLEAAIEEHVDAICISGLDDQKCIPYYDKAKEEKIPIIVFESRTDYDGVTSTCATDNYEAASLVAEKMADSIISGEIAIITHSNLNNSGKDRRDGFKYKILNEFKQITIVDIQYCEGNSEKAENIARNIFQEYPNLKGIFGTNESAMIGILSAMKGLERKDVVVAGFDSGTEQINAVCEESELGFIAQDPINMGYIAVETAIKAVSGSEILELINVNYEWVDSNNIGEDKIKEMIYE